MAEFAPEMPVKSALVPIGAESVRRCSSAPPMREGAHFGAGLIHPGQSLICVATSEPSMPTTFCASQWPCGSVLLGDFGIGGMLIGEVEAMLCQ